MKAVYAQNPKFHKRQERCCFLAILLLAPLIFPPLLLGTSVHVFGDIKETATRPLPSTSRQQIPLFDRFGYRLPNIASGGHVFFRHMRKASGTSMLHYLAHVIRYRLLNQTSAARTTPPANDSSPIQKMTIMEKKIRPVLKWFLYHQEFGAMPWKCPTIDKERWESTFSVIVLREPIDRQVSEFWYSGPGKTDPELKKLVNEYSTPIRSDNNGSQGKDDIVDKIFQRMAHLFPQWIKKGMEELSGRNFHPNYQTKMLSGETNFTPNPINHDRYEHCNTCCSRSLVFQSPSSHIHINSTTTVKLLEQLKDCFKVQNPCAYGTKGAKNRRSAAIWQGGIRPTRNNATELSLMRAKQALQSFDLVLLTETLSQQAQMVSDMFQVPLDVVPLGKHRVTTSRPRAGNTSHAQTYTPRGLSNGQGFSKYKSSLIQKAPKLYNLLYELNTYDVALYDYARRLNAALVDQWKVEKTHYHTRRMPSTHRTTR